MLIFVITEEDYYKLEESMVYVESSRKVIKKQSGPWGQIIPFLPG